MPLAALVIVLVAATLLIAVPWRREAQRRREVCVLANIGVAVQQNLPLPRALAAAAYGERGRARRALLRIAQGLEAGLPLSLAVRTCFPEMPPDVLSTLAASESAGTLPSALRIVQAQRARQRERFAGESPVPWSYGAVVIVVLVGIVVLMSIFVGPKLAEMVADVHTDRPVPDLGLLAWDASAAAFPSTTAGRLFYAAVLLTAWALAAALLFRVAAAMRRGADWPPSVVCMVDALRWRLPALGQLEAARAVARSLPILELSLAAGWGLADAVDHAAEVDVNTVWRRRLLTWSRMLHRGDDAAASARAVGLPQLLVSAVEAGVREGDLTPGLRYCREYYDGVVRHRMLMLRAAAWPAMTLALGALVANVMLPVFQTLRFLMEVACDQVGQ